MKPGLVIVMQAFEVIDAEIAQHEGRLGELRQARETLARLWCAPSAPPTSSPAPSRAVRRVPASKPKKAHGRPPRDREALQEQILEWLGHQATPVAFKILRGSLKVKTATLREALTALVAAGSIVRTGKTAATRIGLPSVMAAAAAAAKAIAVPEKPVTAAPRAPKSVEPQRSKPPAGPAPVATVAAAPKKQQESDSTLRDALQRVLRTGASYDVRELVRNVRQTLPHVDAGLLGPVLEDLRVQGEITRIPLGDSFRYRALARTSKAAIA